MLYIVSRLFVTILSLTVLSVLKAFVDNKERHLKHFASPRSSSLSTTLHEPRSLRTLISSTLVFPNCSIDLFYHLFLASMLEGFNTGNLCVSLRWRLNEAREQYWQRSKLRHFGCRGNVDNECWLLVSDSTRKFPLWSDLCNFSSLFHLFPISI